MSEMNCIVLGLKTLSDLFADKYGLLQEGKVASKKLYCIYDKRGIINQEIMKTSLNR
jgi:hypothetical protein